MPRINRFAVLQAPAGRPLAPPTQKKSTGRPRGKHSNPEYTQTTIYLPTKLRNEVRMRLYREGGELSSLVEALLVDWQKDHPKAQQRAVKTGSMRSR